MKAVILSLFLFATMAVSAQNPVTWTFTSKKLTDNSYEISYDGYDRERLAFVFTNTARRCSSQPTTFSITNNPLIEVVGKIKEVGKMQKFHDKELEISANQYSEKVEFVQTIKLKGKVKTSFSGSVEFQTCDDKKCLPPKTVNFKVALD